MIETAILLRAGSSTGFWLFALVWVLAVALYFLPSIVAGLRGHHQLGPIVIINVLLGWTLVGWVVAFAWSVSHIPARTP